MSDYYISPEDNQLSLPVADRTIETLYSVFLLHRRPRHEAPQILKEYYRVLKPGGRLIIRVPNLDWIARRYMEGKIPFSELDRIVYGNQNYEADYIETAFDLPRVMSLLSGAGFVNSEMIALDEINMEIQATKRMDAENL